MYDIAKPVLVFVTQTHHPVLEHHTGYIFAEYDYEYHKPRELFFAHIHEAQIYALYRGAVLELDPDSKPGIVTAQNYVLTAEDDSRFMLVPDLRLSDEHRARAQKRGKANAKTEWVPMPEPQEEVEPVVDWFGEDEP